MNGKWLPCVINLSVAIGYFCMGGLAISIVHVRLTDGYGYSLLGEPLTTLDHIHMGLIFGFLTTMAVVLFSNVYNQ